MKKRIYHDSKMSYLIIEPETDIASSLSMNMMKNNKIQGLLDMECRYVDNNLALYYEIQGMQPVKEYTREHNINYNIAKQLYMDIAQAVLNGEEFFLNENSYVMDLEYIFWDKKNKNIKLCCVPGLQGNFQEDIKKLTESVIECINHDDKNAAEFIYGIYNLIIDSGFIISDVKAYIKGFKPGNLNHAFQNKQDNTIEKDNNKKYINVHNASNNIIAGSRDYSCEAEKNIISNASCQNNIEVCSIEPERKNKYVLCIDKSSLPFITYGKGSIDIYLEDIGISTGENQLEANIGRSRDCNLILPVCYISRHHAVFYIENSSLYIEDTGSANGTFINGEKIPANVKIPCNSEDIISFAGILCKLSFL